MQTLETHLSEFSGSGVDSYLPGGGERGYGSAWGNSYDRGRHVGAHRL